MIPRVLRLLLATTCLATAADFPAPYNSEPGGQKPTTPRDALGALKLPPGFKATLFAAEPDVQNPIAMAWDGRGRMWIAENYTYAERGKRFDLSLNDRVLILEDRDWDGAAETRSVFTDQVQMLTGIEIGRGGVWLMCPPQVLFVPDANGDDVPDSAPQVALDGFTVAKDNYHNFANGLRFAPDGWLYGRCGHSCPGRIGAPGTPEERRIPIKGGIWRFHPERKIVEVLTHGTTNPWGHDWDANGEMFFINTVTGHLWHLIHGAHLVDSSAAPNPFVYERLDTIADHYHYDRGATWKDGRDGRANSLGGGHAHIGMMIYQADQWPAGYLGRLFTLNMHGRRANVERLERHRSGYVGRHEPDVLFSDDPWFRGIEISAGPDGSGFVIDWSDIGECHESNGVHRASGRVFRVSHGDPMKPAKPFAWRKPWPTPDLRSADEHARALAIRELAQFWPIDLITGERHPQAVTDLRRDDAKLWRALLGMAKSDESAFVRLNLASVLQRLPYSRRPALATALLSHKEDADDPFLPHMVWFGIGPLAAHDPAALARIASACSWPKVTRWIARSLAPQPDALNALLAAGVTEPILEGIADAFKGIRKAPKPANWDQIANSDTATRVPGLIRDLSVLFGDGRALDDVKRIALDPDADPAAREAALMTLIETRPPDLRSICEKLLETRNLGTSAARGLALFDDPNIGAKLAGNYRKFQAGERPAVLDALVSRPAFAKAALDEMAAGRIPRADLTAFQARRIRAFNDDALDRKLADAWGEFRESGADTKRVIDGLKANLGPEVLASADLGQGRALFSGICAACHVMYGQGTSIGPDLTGSGRASLDYLLENIVDPGGIVGADYRMSLLTHEDGRALAGIVIAKNDRTLTLRTLTESMVLDRGEIAKLETSPLSMMPEGLLLALQPAQIRDLIAYLMHPSQVPMPSAK